MLDPNLSFPATSSPLGFSRLGVGQSLAPLGLARTMPDLRQTLEGIPPAIAADRGKRTEPNRAEVTIFHPMLGPSAEITENVLMARALLSPTYVHDSAATRMARVSTMPNRGLSRFGGTLDVWA